MNVSIMLNLKVMFIIGLLFIGLTAIIAEEIENKQNEGKLSSAFLYIDLSIKSYPFEAPSLLFCYLVNAYQSDFNYTSSIST